MPPVNLECALPVIVQCRESWNRGCGTVSQQGAVKAAVDSVALERLIDPDEVLSAISDLWGTKIPQINEWHVAGRRTGRSAVSENGGSLLYAHPSHARGRVRGEKMSSHSVRVILLSERNELGIGKGNRPVCCQ